MKKLTYINNWATDEYYVGEQRIIDLFRVTIAGQEFDVTSRTVEVPYSDRIRADLLRHYFITVDILGQPMEFDLNTLIRTRECTVNPEDVRVM